MKSTTAHLYLQIGHLQLAEKYIIQVEADPKAPPLLKLLNAALKALCCGDLDVAIDSLQQILKSEPDNPVVCINIQSEFW